MINLQRHILKKISIILLLVLGFSATIRAQFIDLHLNINSKLTASTVRPLDFGTLTTNSGRKAINFGSSKMGIFSITALENEVLLVTLLKPDKLHNENAAIKDTIPMELFSRYGYIAQNYQNSFRLTQTSSIIKVKPNPDPTPWNTIYIYMYGSVNIGNVPDGIYSNNIVLDVEYL
ncbi:MAG TPA: hypothetical protein VJ964_14495 [Balneolaceae bacterium]|nr:hypothetical protein [Balneolaceae bacterium]